MPQVPTSGGQELKHGLVVLEAVVDHRPGLQRFLASVWSDHLEDHWPLADGEGLFVEGLEEDGGQLRTAQLGVQSSGHAAAHLVVLLQLLPGRLPVVDGRQLLVWPQPHEKQESTDELRVGVLFEAVGVTQGSERHQEEVVDLVDLRPARSPLEKLFEAPQLHIFHLVQQVQHLFEPSGHGRLGPHGCDYVLEQRPLLVIQKALVELWHQDLSPDHAFEFTFVRQSGHLLQNMRW